MVVGPATYTVLAIIGVLILLGVYLLRSGRGRRGQPRATHQPADGQVCGRCQCKNPPGASYCARCGSELKSQDS